MKRFLNLYSLGLLLATSMVGGLVPANAQQDGKRRAPPPEAMQACTNQSEGAVCTFSGRRGEVTGACIVVPEIDSQLACAPKGSPRDERPRN